MPDLKLKGLGEIMLLNYVSFWYPSQIDTHL